MQPTIIQEPIRQQIAYLGLLGLAVACISWTVTHEEVFREPREFCKNKSENCKPLYQRKFFYLFTCEYCLSHYVAAATMIVTHFRMLYLGWRGFLISEFALVWVVNIYMSAFNRLRLEIKAENLSISSRKE